MKKEDATMQDVYDIVKKTVSRQVGSVTRFGVEEEDVVQEVMIKVTQNWDKYKGDCQVSSWVYQITRNTIINLAIKHNREKRKALAEYSIEDNELDFAGEEELEDDMVYNEKIEILNEYISENFNEDEKKVFRGMLKGYSNQKISDIFDIPYIRVTKISKKIKSVRLEY